MSLPAIAAQIINMLYNLVDRIYIGHIPETGFLALTGVGVCLPVIMTVSAFAALVGMGAAPRASIYMGSGDNDSAEKIMGNSLTLSVITGAVLTAVIIIFGRPLLLLFGASENTVWYSLDYLRIYAVGTTSVLLSLGLNAFVTAQGFAGVSMATVVIGAAANIVLDPIFIFVFRMGVKGAALATVISQSISAAWVILFLSGVKTVPEFHRKYFENTESRKIRPFYLKVEWSGKTSILKLRPKNFRLCKIILPCLGLGAAPFIMQITESVLMICFNSSLKTYGGDLAVGAMTIITSVMQLMMLPLLGLGQGAQPISGYNFGAGKADRVAGVFKRLLSSSVAFVAVLWVPIMCFPKIFIAIFNTDAELLRYAPKMMRIYMAATIVMGVQDACQLTLISIGKSAASVIIACVRKLVLLIPLIYIMPLFMTDKVVAVYAAEPIADVVAVCVTVIIFAAQFRRALRKLRNGTTLSAAPAGGAEGNSGR